MVRRVGRLESAYVSRLKTCLKPVLHTVYIQMLGKLYQLSWDEVLFLQHLNELSGLTIDKPLTTVPFKEVGVCVMTLQWS